MLPNTIPVSVVIITKNEARAIQRCVTSLADYDEVFVVDSHSDDSTAELAEQAGASVVQFTWNGKYPKKKQWAIENLPIRNKWVLLMDGDEYSTKSFDDEVRRIVSTSPSYGAFDVPLDYHFLGRRLRHGHKVTKRILYRPAEFAFPVLDDLGVDNPFEMELHVQPIALAGATVGRASQAIVHDDLERLYHYFDRHNRYSDWEAHLLRQRARSTQSARSRTARGGMWARVPFKPIAFLLYSLIAKRGVFDGAPGIHYAIAQMFYYWQIGVKARYESDE